MIATHKSYTKSSHQLLQLAKQDKGQKPRDFSQRHIGPTSDKIQQMLEILDISFLGDLIEKTVPQKFDINNPSICPSL